MIKIMKNPEIIIKKIINQLYKEDDFLIRNNVCERSLMFRIALYLQKEFPEYFVDCELNKMGTKQNGKSCKIMQYNEGDEPKKVYIDIIIHRRKPDKDDSNYICIEIKRTKKGIEKDINRIKRMTKQDYAFEYQGNKYLFGYKYGFLLYLPKDLNKKSIRKFINGIEESL